jgi:hypothetical protein
MSEHKHIDQHVRELLNGGVDGVLSAAEQDELNSLLAGSAQLRDLDEELKTFTGLLDGLQEVEPPPYLQESIERQIRLPVQSNQHEEKQGFLGTWLPAHWLRTGFALAAGAVLTVGIYEMGSGPMTTEDASKLVGTVVKSQAADQGELLDSIHVFTNTLNGRIELRNKDDLFTLDVQLNSDGPTQVILDFAGRGLEYEGITRMQDQMDAVTIVDGSVNVTSSGEKRYTLNLRRTKNSEGQEVAPLGLDFFANNMLVHEAELSITQH